MEWLLLNWQGLMGGGSLTSIIVYLFNRSNSKADVLTKVGSIYETLVTDLKEDREILKQQVLEFKEEVSILKKEFKIIQADYHKEVETNKNWEKMYSEIADKYDKLKLFCDKLKIELDKYKKTK